MKHAARLKSWACRYWNSLSFVGLIVGLLFFAVSLTPSLLPRTFVVQGILSGLALAIGYGIGNLVLGLWRYLQIPEVQGKPQKVIKWILGTVVVLLSIGFLWHTTIWQNSIRGLMGMEPAASAYAGRVAPIAFLVGALLIGLGWVVGSAFRFFSRRISRVVPPRVSKVISLVVVGILVVTFVRGVLAKRALTGRRCDVLKNG